MATTTFWKTPFAVLSLSAIVLGGVVATVNVVRRGAVDDDGSLPPELTVASLAQAAEKGALGAGTFRGLLERDDLTDEQRREALRNVRELRRQQMDARVQEYFDAKTDQERLTVLDSQIDEFMEMRQRWERRREERRREDANEPDRERLRELFQPPSQQERKSRSESRNPDETARRVAYFSAMRSRMSERGISMGGGRGGRGRP